MGNMKWSHYSVLFFILLMSFIIRVFGIDFGLPFFHHPDEEFIVVKALRLGLHKDLNPGFYIYGTLYLYFIFFLYSVYFLIGYLLGIFSSVSAFGESFFKDPTVFFLIGRVATVLIGTASVYMIYLIGKRLFNHRIGVISSFFLGFSFLHVRDSHYATVDVPMTFFLLLTIFFACRILKKEPNYKSYILSGFAAGMAIATKLPAAMVILPLLFAHWSQAEKKTLRAFLSRNLLVGAFAMVMGFLIFSPYTIIDLSGSIKSMKNIIFHRQIIFPGTEVYGLGYKYYLFHALPIALGFPLFLLSLFGLIYGFGIHRKEELFLGIFPLGYYLFMGSSKYFPDRYIMPLLPFLILLAASLLKRITDLTKLGKDKRFLILLCFLLILPSAYNAVKQDFRFSTTDTRIVAKNWIEENLLPKAKIFSETYGPPLNITHERAKELLKEAQEEDKRRGSSFLYLLNRPEPEKSYYLYALPAKNMPFPFNSYVEKGFDYFILSSFIYERYLPKPYIYGERMKFYKDIEAHCELIYETDRYALKSASKKYKSLKNLLITLWGRQGPIIKIYKRAD